MDNVEVAMTLIAQAGDSRSYCMEAVALAKEGKFDEAKKALENAANGMIAAHETQTDLIRKEMEGTGEPVSLLMVHAQDHLNLALIMRDVAEEFVYIHEKFVEMEGR
ncbi:PTS system, cellobiose-specific IIA component [Lachnospiraceae bacterium G11]|jgi:PTS system cellobiose-specific IIA component|nr:PTS lactose/cellobiose transporter subunit IIA [Lachnospiraceae bacterium]SDA74725.1 PTS system, cellobiose-specific IIA component [Lachnospiraceae bacterium G11]